MRTLLLSIILFVFSLSAQEVTPEVLQQIDKTVQAFAQKQKGGGVAVAVIYPDKSSQGYRRDNFMYGHDKGPQSAPPKVNSIFYLASVTKVLTATVLAKFVQEGKVKLDDPAQKYVPASVRVPTFNGKQITLRDLATHTSGLPSEAGDVKHPYHYERSDFYKWLSGYKLKYAPGTKSVYSNVGFGFLGLILSNVAHMEYEDVIIKELCDPLNMPDTRMRFSDNQKERLSDFYNQNGKMIHAGCCIALPALGGGGAFASTLNDMTRFLIFNMGLLNTPMNGALSILHDTQFTIGPANYIGLGWYDNKLYSNGSIMKISKNGGMPGVSTYLVFVKESKTGVVVLTNTDSESTIPLGNAILKILNPLNK